MEGMNDSEGWVEGTVDGTPLVDGMPLGTPLVDGTRETDGDWLGRIETEGSLEGNDVGPALMDGAEEIDGIRVGDTLGLVVGCCVVPFPPSNWYTPNAFMRPMSFLVSPWRPQYS
jgi:hypothetical protein